MQVYFEEVHFFKNVRISIIKIGIARSNFSIRGVMKQYRKKGGCEDYRLVVYYASLVILKRPKFPWVYYGSIFIGHLNNINIVQISLGRLSYRDEDSSKI